MNWVVSKIRGYAKASRVYWVLMYEELPNNQSVSILSTPAMSNTVLSRNSRKVLWGLVREDLTWEKEVSTRTGYSVQGWVGGLDSEEHLMCAFLQSTVTYHTGINIGSHTLWWPQSSPDALSSSFSGVIFCRINPYAPQTVYSQASITSCCFHFP